MSEDTPAPRTYFDYSLKVPMKRDTNLWNFKKVKVHLSVPAHYRDKGQTLCDLYGTDANELWMRFIDELWFDPLEPTLPKRLERAKEKVLSFYRKRHPEWLP